MEEDLTKRMVLLVVVFLLFAAGSSVYAGSYGDGYAAYKKGDYVTAVREFRIAAEQGNAYAQYILGVMYDRGQGVPQDYTEAVKWYRKAAEQRDANAQNNLGAMYYQGQGVPQNYVQAHMWYNLAATQGNESAIKNRELLSKEMTPTQLAEAQELARKWFELERTPQPSYPSTSQGKSSGTRQKIVSTGAGFFVSKMGHILTNEHVVKGCMAVQVRLPGGNAISAKALHVNTDVDLAVLKIDPSLAMQVIGWSGQAVEFRSDGNPRLGEGVVVYGFPLTGALASEGNLTIGNITALAGPKDDGRLYQISAPIQPGNSGGPLFDESGRVIGIVVAKLDAVKMAAVTGDIPSVPMIVRHLPPLKLV